MSQTVLVIEDDKDTLSIYATALEERGYDVLTAETGADGVHLGRTQRPNLVLLDIRLPLMDGWTALKYLRSYQETENIPVFGISAYAPYEEVRDRLGSLSFDRFLTKPIDPHDVVRAVEAQIGPPDGDEVAMPSAENL